jgi:aminopeptidase
VKEGQRLYVSSTTLAQPLLLEIHRAAVKANVGVEYDLGFEGKGAAFWEEHMATYWIWNLVFRPMPWSILMPTWPCGAPFDLYEELKATPEQKKRRAKAGERANQFYFKRTADKSMVRSLCQFPTQASAEAANMSLSEYADFVFNACRLNEPDPVEAWLQVRKNQQGIVDFLNTTEEIRYKNEKSDIRFSVKGRTWINSDGRANMPSGEVFTGPVEESVEGVVHFDYPSVYGGHDVQGITLYVKNGKVEKWEAETGQKILDQVFAIEGSRYFGEVAIGTNYRIQQATRNILFDEKIGGSIHMAVGQSYLQTGGKNQSTVHWDMISDMRSGGEIWADGELIYKNGKFLEKYGVLNA